MSPDLSGGSGSPIKAIDVNIAIMRTFVKLRRLMETNSELRRKIEDLEKKYDEQFRLVFKVIKSLLSEKSKPRKSIGFQITKRINRLYSNPFTSVKQIEGWTRDWGLGTWDTGHGILYN